MLDCQQAKGQVKQIKAPHAIDVINSTAITLPQDNIFAELDTIVPDGDLQILVEVTRDEDWDAIEHILCNGDHTCPEFFWTDNPPMPEHATSEFNPAKTVSYTP